jgi:hypothetical protein
MCISTIHSPVFESSHTFLKFYCGAYSYRHTKLSFLSDIDHQKSDYRSSFNRTNWCNFGQVHAEEHRSSGMLTPCRLTIRLFLFTNRHGVTFINTWESYISQVHSLICAALLQCCRHNTWGKVIWTCRRYFVKRHKDVKTKSHMLWPIVTPVWSAGCERRTAVQFYGYPRSCRYIFPTSDVNTTATGNRQKCSILQFSDYSLRTAACFLSLQTICPICDDIFMFP